MTLNSSPNLDLFKPLNPALNLKPAKVKSIYLMGIGGVAMTALAGLLAENGYQVSGSDQNLYPPMSDILKSLNLTLFEGYKPENLSSRPDLVIIGNVVTRLFTEINYLAELKIPYLSLPQAINQFFLEDKRPVVVSGCHGKTTTTSLTAHILTQNGLNPGFLIGGAAANFKHAFNVGSGKYFVIEGDEYDDAFFSKQPKFVHYKPELVILTSIEFDHADIYPDLESMIEAYRKLIKLIPKSGHLVANGDDPLVRKVAAEAKCQVDFYGQNPENHWQLVNISSEGLEVRFELLGPDCFYAELIMPKPGIYNAFNAAAASIIALKTGMDARLLAPALQSFKGVKRRQELIGEFKGITLIDDFAHHPTAVDQTLVGLKAAFPEKRLLAFFEPRSNTSRRAIFQEDYAKSLAQADLVFLRTVPDPQKAPDGNRLDINLLAASINEQGTPTHIFTQPEEACRLAATMWAPGDVVVVMSNGGFDDLLDKLKESLS